MYGARPAPESPYLLRRARSNRQRRFVPPRRRGARIAGSAHMRPVTPHQVLRATPSGRHGGCRREIAACDHDTEAFCLCKTAEGNSGVPFCSLGVFSWPRIVAGMIHSKIRWEIAERYHRAVPDESGPIHAGSFYGELARQRDFSHVHITRMKLQPRKRFSTSSCLPHNSPRTSIYKLPDISTVCSSIPLECT